MVNRIEVLLQGYYIHGVEPSDNSTFEDFYVSLADRPESDIIERYEALGINHLVVEPYGAVCTFMFDAMRRYMWTCPPPRELLLYKSNI